MPNNNKRRDKTNAEPATSTRILVTPAPDSADAGRAPWRKMKVRPELDSMPTDPPEAGIGKRIARCRAHLDNLSLEALARYTKHFDSLGVSSKSLARYEANETLPGVRELRILADTLWVPVEWLMFGVEQTGEDQADPAELTALLAAFKRWARKHARDPMQPFNIQSDAERDKALTERRQQRLYEARRPSKAEE